MTNTQLDASATLRAYKYQPKLERRHALLKSGLQVAPIFLKKNSRIEALMFVYFLAQLVCALIERQLRMAMRKRGLPHIQIPPEDRPSATPPTEQVIRVFSSRARHLLFSRRPNGTDFHRPAQSNPRTDPEPHLNIPASLCVNRESSGNCSQTAECRIATCNRFWETEFSQDPTLTRRVFGMKK